MTGSASVRSTVTNRRYGAFVLPLMGNISLVRVMIRPFGYGERWTSKDGLRLLFWKVTSGVYTVSHGGKALKVARDG